MFSTQLSLKDHASITVTDLNLRPLRLYFSDAKIDITIVEICNRINGL